jgi:LytS/YehU family sensor histidine kinase
MALLRATLAGLLHLHGIGAHFTPFAIVISKEPWLLPVDEVFPYGCALLTWSSLYFGINAMLDLEIERARVVRALKLADSARLRALQSQLNPHFLFNSLNGIATLIRENDGTMAAEMVDTLSDFLRLTLQKFESPEIVVAEELEFIERYLRIQRFRFGSRLRASVDADPETYGALLPTLILQPLVENAVRHGVLAREEGGALSVSIRKRDGVLVVSVEDDGPGIGAGGAKAFGVGLGNSAERLSALYGDDANMSVGPRPGGGGFAVVLRLPFRKAPETRASSSRLAAAV